MAGTGRQSTKTALATGYGRPEMRWSHGGLQGGQGLERARRVLTRRDGQGHHQRLQAALMHAARNCTPAHGGKDLRVRSTDMSMYVQSYLSAVQLCRQQLWKTMQHTGSRDRSFRRRDKPTLRPKGLACSGIPLSLLATGPGPDGSLLAQRRCRLLKAGSTGELQRRGWRWACS